MWLDKWKSHGSTKSRLRLQTPAGWDLAGGDNIALLANDCVPSTSFSSFSTRCIYELPIHSQSSEVQ